MKEFKSAYIVRYFGNYFYKNQIWVCGSVARVYHLTNLWLQIAMELCDEGSVTDLIAELKSLDEPMIWLDKVRAPTPAARAYARRACRRRPIADAARAPAGVHQAGPVG